MKAIVPISVCVLCIGGLLSIVQIVPERSLLLGERLFPNGGWIQIVLAMLYGGLLCYKMLDRKNRSVWRRRSWLLFSIIFFGQLLLGIFADHIFLMTGELHLPIPAIILAGPLYRLEGLFMPLLFISTLLLSGPAWCSQLCYFGAFDAWSAARSKPERKIFPFHRQIRYTTLFFIIVGAITLRLCRASETIATILGLVVGLVGLCVMFSFSRKHKKMVHCSSYCPIGTLISFLKYLSPFRMRLTNSCCHCMACVNVCRYDALHKEEIEKGRIGRTCTYCGDCLTACQHRSIEYQIFNLKPKNAELLWILINVIIHTCFLAIARI